jgi:alpha/beta hydrolase fold
VENHSIRMRCGRGRLIIGAAIALVAAGVWPRGGTPAAFQPAAMGVDRFITVNGLRIHFLDWGNEGKPPFIMLHGISRTAHTFDHVARRYQKDYHVIAVDMRGHGDSDWDPKAQYLAAQQALDGSRRPHHDARGERERAKYRNHRQLVCRLFAHAQSADRVTQTALAFELTLAGLYVLNPQRKPSRSST